MTGGFWRPGERNAASINDDILGWLDRRPAERPFFVFANYIDAHTPYAPPDEYRWRYTGSRSSARRPPPGDMKEPPSAELTQALRDAYDGSITYLDAQLAALFRELDKRGVTSNTIILISSDHGEQFGEHGFLEHGASLYLHELHVPLMIRLPNREHRGCVVRDWVTLRDIPATLSDAAQLELDPPFPGHSLVTRCSGKTPEDPSPILAETVGRPHLPGWYPASEGDIQGVIFGNMHYTRRGSGAERLFDTSVDSMEMHDLSGDPAHAASLKTARLLLSTSRR
jgi:arylsulfatase A-like enzyme